MPYVSVAQEGDIHGTPAIRKLLAAQTGSGVSMTPDFGAWTLPRRGLTHRLQLWFSGPADEIMTELESCGEMLMTLESQLQGVVSTHFRGIRLDRAASGLTPDDLFLICLTTDSFELTPVPVSQDSRS